MFLLFIFFIFHNMINRGMLTNYWKFYICRDLDVWTVLPWTSRLGKYKNGKFAFVNDLTNIMSAGEERKARLFGDYETWRQGRRRYWHRWSKLSRWWSSEFEPKKTAKTSSTVKKQALIFKYVRRQSHLIFREGVKNFF